MVSVSKFSVTRFSVGEMRPKWDSNEVKYPNFVRVDIRYDGEFEDATGCPKYQHSKTFWCASSFQAHKIIILSIFEDIL